MTSYPAMSVTQRYPQNGPDQPSEGQPLRQGPGAAHPSSTQESWRVQVSPGDVRIASSEQLWDFFRLGIIDEQAFIWREGMESWLPVSYFLPTSQPQQPEQSWHVQFGPNEVRVVTLDELDRLFNGGVLTESTYVWQPDFAHWVTLSSLLEENPSDDEASDVWHVELDKGEIKQLDLDQLDTYYRYDLIDESTRIWKSGMPEWLPLGAVAGISDASAHPVLPRPQLEPAQATRQTLAASNNLQIQPLPDKRPPVSTVAYQPPTAPPLAVSIKPTEPTPRRRDRYGLMYAAAAAGLFVGFLRNDVVYSAASTLGLGPQYTSLEHEWLGGPAIGTPRNVEQLIKECGGPLHLIQLPADVQNQNHTTQQQSLGQLRGSLASPSSKGPSDPPVLAATHPSPKQAEQAKAAVATSTGATPIRNGQSRVAGSSHKKPMAAAPKRAAPRKGSSSSKSTFGGKGDFYDPLNPTM